MSCQSFLFTWGNPKEFDNIHRMGSKWIKVFLDDIKMACDSLTQKGIFTAKKGAAAPGTTSVAVDSQMT